MITDVIGGLITEVEDMVSVFLGGHLTASAELDQFYWLLLDRDSSLDRAPDKNIGCHQTYLLTKVVVPQTGI